MKIEKPKVTIVTHSGKFHSDDVFGVAVLYMFLEKQNQDIDIQLIRTRDIEKIDNADFVVDVGGVYDPDNNRFDHHQKTGAGDRDNGVPYASFGLVWKKYGDVLSGSEIVSKYIDNKIVLSADARDNGVVILKNLVEGVTTYSAFDFMESYNVSWKEDSILLDERFIKVLGFAKECLAREILRAKDKFEAIDIVENIYNNTEDKRLIILDTYYPWSDVLSKYPDTRLVVYPNLNRTEYHIQVIQDQEFVNSRISLPQTWAGLEHEGLEKISGVPGALFCHTGLWIASAKTKESAIKLAKIALKQS
jgi:uncharacterized UPF0160 family protein